MSYPVYKDGRLDTVWDFECPLCDAHWNNEGDPIGEGEESDEECPGCEAQLVVTASYSVDYELNVKPDTKAQEKPNG